MRQRPVDRMRRAGLAASLGLALPRALRAQAAWPERPITLVVPFGPGGIADLTARTVAQAMSATLKVPIVIDNKPSAGSIVGSAAVAQAAPDGHTLLLMSNANAVSAGLFRKLPFDVQKDFAPVGLLGVFDLALFVAEGSRFRSVRELLDEAKAKPGKLTIATIAVGSTQNLSAELFKSRSGADVLIVPYKGTPAVLTALRAGEVDAAFEILGPMLPQLQARAVRALAVTSDQRFQALPEVPTMMQAGVANYDVASWNALAAPARTPQAVIDKLNAAANEALKTPAVRDKLLALGVRPQGGTPQQLSALLASEIRHWGEVIRAAKIEPE
ncbi:MAG: tripartite tricarboxylate transporter substrate binding protein [Burkholderiaceae bacterium]|nr:tripartite tricarboxylate transporter substrate binding protein [Burkholderiaceae bacterium]